ncbi:hypothetical protein N806_10920 [Rhodococcus sp. P27]|nr:hypothetical protein N806_10920 [Rhodococcus sp. P27]
MQVQETGAALLKLGATNASASVLLAKLVQVVAEEAARTPRFAKAIESAFAVPSDGSAAVVPAAAPAPRRRAAAPKVKRGPGAFDPFDVFNADGEAALLERLSASMPTGSRTSSRNRKWIPTRRRVANARWMCLRFGLSSA